MLAPELEDGKTTKHIEEQMTELQKKLDDLYRFRDFYFENHALDNAVNKTKDIGVKMNELIAKFNELDESQLQPNQRAQYLYMKGRTYNVNPEYDPRASQCLSRAVRLNPKLVDAWNELGECYWKNVNIKDAKGSFEGALKTERNKTSLRCLSIILRQEFKENPSKNLELVDQSVNLAKEAVALDCSDGVSWSVLGNAYLCQFFQVAQEPATLKACMSAYKMATKDPIARTQPDLNYNRGVALKYDEQYEEALESLEMAKKLDPAWSVPAHEADKLTLFLQNLQELTKSRGKIKTKKLQQMLKSIDEKCLGPYSGPYTFGKRQNVKLTPTHVSNLVKGANEGTLLVGKVVGSILSDNIVPFTFAMVDKELSCVAVTVYNLADGKGVIIGDTVVIPEPVYKCHTVQSMDTVYEFKSIRVDNPTALIVNGKKIKRNEIAGIQMTSTYQIH